LQAVADPAAGLQGLYERHSDRILRYCLGQLRSRQEAEDALQSTFLCALRALQRGVVPSCEIAWLLKIAQNVCLTSHRSNGRRREREFAQDPELLQARPGREADDDELFGLDEALALIPESQRRAIILREWRGLTYREIAAQLGLSVAAVETLIFRARRSLAQALNGETRFRGRLAGALDLGSLISAVKTAFSGATAAKLVATASVLAVATLPAGDSLREPRASDASAAVTAATSEADRGRPAIEVRGVEQPRARPSRPSLAKPASSRSGRPTEGSAPATAGTGRSRPGSTSDEREPDTRTSGPEAGSGPGPTAVPSSDPIIPTGTPPVTPPLPLPAPPALPPVELPDLPPLPTPALTDPLGDLPVELPDPGSTLPAVPQLP
jgi:RNA polymerase sigma-70 factor (ECF subfamily)